MYEKLFTLQEDIFKVLANQKRLEIIQLLGAEELTVGQMVKMLGLPQANLSQHLMVLRAAHLVSFRRAKQTIYYHLTDSRISDACAIIKAMLADGPGLSDEEKGYLSRQHILYPLVRDPICGMRLSHAETGASLEKGGKLYYFCAAGCRDVFSEQNNRVRPKESIHG